MEMKKAFKCKSAAQGAEIIQYLVGIGGNNEFSLIGDSVGLYYFIDEENIITTISYITTGYTEGFLPQENKYPKVMLVKHSEYDYWGKRVVFMEKNGKYIAWKSAETFEEAEKQYDTTTWDFAKDIEEEKPLELTLEEIAEKFNIKVENLKIVK